jgi:hypothetical protein
MRFANVNVSNFGLRKFFRKSLPFFRGLADSGSLYCGKGQANWPVDQLTANAAKPSTVRSTPMQGISEIQKDLSSYTLKNLAIFAMFFDHIFAVFVPQDSLEGVALRILGRIAAPIMCYMIAEGYHYTSNLKKYIVRLAAVRRRFAFSVCLVFRSPVVAGNECHLGFGVGIGGIGGGQTGGLVPFR